MSDRITTLRALAARVRDCAMAEETRSVVAIAGPPGAGKSVLSAELALALGPNAAVVPMDGFHLDNRLIAPRGLLARKGAPETFDALGVVHAVTRLTREAEVVLPAFDRAGDQAIAGAVEITGATRVALVEGNYLLADVPPWSALAPLWTLRIVIDVPRAVLSERLVQRWRDHGLSPADALRRAEENDLRNADWFAAHLGPHDIVYAPLDEAG
ncbi:nucleoside/nucleotide kinase family protein [Acuticoccus kandeliae]|uniref:nucleoside/nucleotide kinase family protein n=1 Tax=Acuticoccus kandeliae TaxID=2073160 RepID=UPI000D3E04A5|nr:nucleoside/nucleotide kinase family protein [Acuticoccus kandeliae]